jgi:hypothetical protein
LEGGILHIAASALKAREEGGLRTRTAQLISPAAQTRGEVLHVRVVLSCCGSVVMLVFPPAAVNALWHTVEAWHTLHPVPVHPEGHAHAEPETFPNEVAVAPETSGRCSAWNMLPPHAGAEHVGPPKPGGQAHADELMGDP